VAWAFLTVLIHWNAVLGSCESALEADASQRGVIAEMGRSVRDLTPVQAELKALAPRYGTDPDLAPLAARRDALRKSLKQGCEKFDEARDRFERANKEMRARQMLMLLLRSAKGAPRVDKSLGPVLEGRDISDRMEAALKGFRVTLAEDEAGFKIAMEGRAKARRYQIGFFISLAVMGVLAILDVALIFRRAAPAAPALPARAVPVLLPAPLDAPRMPALTAGFMSFVGIAALGGSCLAFSYLDDIGPSTRQQFLQALSGIRSFLIGSALLSGGAALVSGAALGMLEKESRYGKAVGLGIIEGALCAAAFSAMSLPGWYVELFAFVPFPAAVCGALLSDPKAWKPRS